MTSFAEEVDAQFFEMMHRLSKQAPGRSDRRGEGRHAYPTLQRIAPYDGRTMPAAEQFLTVRCHDLNRAGFSFLFPRRPAFRRLVAAFSSGGRAICVEAAVVQITRALVYSNGAVELFGQTRPPLATDAVGGRAEPALLVGCRFVRRLGREQERPV